ncbi:alcohol dehydrogenase catalytic domain-containing protein [Streptomyces sp. NBC_01754]|uniref:alcohol dehydrogenase catalytic domain-containing protein n=1 Tax=Streptomyces sp. NBC_01754 TaxID=2975930 RepID=UPI002DDA1E5E|nr:alcohol dehydrogenase catalytic domain-containing protein [Streptomyces sp. NBC_01754]WSC93264.1 alcohol dehydrogenase catalytic domain-containing protein [Streptomyces sp. NBC_01754]
MSDSYAWAVERGSLRQLPIPDGKSPARGTTIIETRYAGLCGSDVAKLNHPWSGPLPQPWYPGHEIVGVDTETGSWAAVDPLVPCLSCHYCDRGHVHLCPGLRRIGWDLPGGLAHAVTVPRDSVVPLPHLHDLAHGVLADPMAVALHGVRCGLRGPVGRLGVIGGGVVGVCTAICAAEAGWDVHMMVREPSRAYHLRLALDSRIALHSADLPQCDAVVDAASGHSDSPVRQALNAVRDGGTVLVQNAYAPRVVLSVPLRDVFRHSITLRGSFSYCRAEGRDDFRDAIQVIAKGGDWAALMTRDRFPLGELPQGLKALRGGSRHRPFKVLLTSGI